MERFAAIVQLRQGRKRVTYPSFSLLLSCSLSGDSDRLNPTGHHGRGMQSLEVRDRVQVRAEPYRQWMGWDSNQNHYSVLSWERILCLPLRTELVLSCGVVFSPLLSVLSPVTPTPRASRHLCATNATGATLTLSLSEHQSCTLNSLLMCHFHILPQP